MEIRARPNFEVPADNTISKIKKASEIPIELQSD